MKPIEFKNKINGDRVVCDNVCNVSLIEQVEYLTVHQPGLTRTFLMRKDILEKITSGHSKF